jgi:ubiquinone/menaquinone biosynthesis C-methylase UbiE
MVVLEPGCGMGFFTLPLAQMVGLHGRVVAVEIQSKMLSVLRRRARKAGLSDRIELRETQPGRLGVDDLSGVVDFTAALHVAHEVPDQFGFFNEVWKALKSDGKLLVVEPKHHVSQDEFSETVILAEKSGFQVDSRVTNLGGYKRLFTKPPGKDLRLKS